uniref:RZ-type domain-containing protein n=1 Tax=Seriola dumerili TaxID=41447 RepID=A0A3B4U3I8_SERDU
METGQTVVLLNLQNLYESLYDALNQYYVTLGGQKYVDLGLGTHRVKCRVHKNFRLIVIEEKEVVYKQFPIPLINRLEKHYLDMKTVLSDEQEYIASQLQEWVDDFVSLSRQHSTKKQYVPSDVFIGYHSDTCSSVVLQVTKNHSDETDAQTMLDKAKNTLLNCATPDSVVRLDKSRLPDEETEHLTEEYVKEEMHRSLGDYIVYHTQHLKLPSFFFTEVTTFSRLLTAGDTQELQNVTKLDYIKLLSLQQFDTEYSFLKEIREFLGSTHEDKVLIIQTEYDEDSHRKNILSSAKYSCINEMSKWATTDNTKTFVYFVSKLPRIEGGTSYVGFQGGPWMSVHIDDLRRSKEFVSDVHSLKNLHISDLFEDPPEGNSLNTFFFFLKNVIYLKHTLWRKIQAVVTPLLANLVSVIDRDCNLDLLFDGDDVRNLWLEIFGSKEMLHVPYTDSPLFFAAHSPGHFRDLFLNTPLGSYMAKNVNEKMGKEFLERYLQDFVSMTMKVPSDEELKVRLLCQALASCVDEIQRRKKDEDELSLPHIHIAYHFYQSRLQNLSWMISLHPEIVYALRRNQHIRHCPEMVLDVLAAKACVEYLGSPDLHTDALCQRWLKQVKRLQASLELICSQQNTKQYGERCRERLRDVGNGWKRIYILSLFVEHMLLGFHHEENCLRELVFSNIQTLSRVKPQDPVGLPCDHICCLPCIKASLDAGRPSCPNCRQQLQNDFQPHVSEDIRNAEFRRRCNGFFIDMLSTVCFKDNIPPTQGVITHLLSCMRVETEDEQIHTKDLSPFKECPDNNPVVRSVILKLLLKFSFDDVKEYLQQHLSSVEESRFVDEGDEAELYALYINCLEVKTSFEQRYNCNPSYSSYISVFLLLYLHSWCEQNEDGGQMDQYLVYGEEYKAVRDAVAKAVVDGDVECTAPPRNRTVFILLALFREVTTLYRSDNMGFHPTPERCQAFGDFIQGSRYLHQREVRDFASALVHNRLGALTIHPGNTIVGNAVIELTIHLAAVLLTGTHLLLMPLKQLGLFPENMQVSFIYAVPVNLSSWTSEQNDLICYVSLQCGLPMQRGQCLECGQEVGGEQHRALPGFTPIQLPQDRTRTGHILGDPERRNNPDALDTKNMSLTPFTLVRLVTHLAMLLGTSEKSQSVQHIIQSPVEDVCLFLTQHIMKDLDQLSQALGRGVDDTITTAHLVLRSLLDLQQANHSGIDQYLTTKESRNSWETTMAAEIMTSQLKFLQEGKGSIRTDSRVSSNFIMRTTFGDDCTFLTSLPQGSQVHSTAVWSCRERLSLLSLKHTMEHNDQKEELPLLWRFLQKEREFRQIKFLPDIVILQKRLVRKFQNASDQIAGSITEFIEKTWYEKRIDIFLKTWNLLRVSVTSSEMKIPDEFCSEDLDLDSDLQYLLPRRQGPGLCATGLVSYLVALQNELVYAVDSHTREDSRLSVAELAEQHVIRYDVEKDLLPLVLSNCQYNLERGHETISQYDLPRIQQQILTRFLQGKPLITCTGIPTLVKTQERDNETIFKAVKGKVHQEPLSSLIRNAVSRELESYSEVCEAFRIMELLLGFLSVTGGDPMMKLVTYLEDVLKMTLYSAVLFLQTLSRCTLRHCVSLWQLLSSLKSENMLRLKRVGFAFVPLLIEDKLELKGFVSRGNMDQWLLEMHEFLLLRLGRPRATEQYNPSWSVKETVAAYVDCKEVEVPRYLEDKFPENLQLCQIVETWKYGVTTKQDLMMKG